MIYIDSHSCPFCGRTYGVHVFGLRSGIGTPQFDCSACGATFESKCREWPQMSWFHKLWYVAVSLGYAVCVGGLLGAILNFSSVMIARGRGDPFLVGDMPWLKIGVRVGIAGVIAFQIFRVVQSIRRSREETPPRLIASRWSPHTNCQILLAGIIALVFGICLVIGAKKSL